MLRHSPLRRISRRRFSETSDYLWRRRQFLLKHPYCQVWLAEHGVSEEDAVRTGGLFRPEGAGGPVSCIPLATEIHHRNKRRGCDLLDQEHWLAVSRQAHRRIEEDKAWARARGFLLPF